MKHLLAFVIVNLFIIACHSTGKSEKYAEIVTTQNEMLDKFAATNKAISDNKAQIDSNSNKLTQVQESIERARETLNAGQKQTDAQIQQVKIELEALRKTPTGNPNQLDQIDKALRSLLELSQYTKDTIKYSQESVDRLSKEIATVSKSVASTQTDVAALQQELSKVSAELKNAHKQEKTQDYSAILKEIAEKQQILLKSLNESSMDHLLHNVNVFLTHFQQGVMHYGREAWMFFVDVGRFARSVSNDIATKGVAGVQAEAKLLSAHVQDLTLSTHRQLVGLLAQQQFIPHQHDANIAWGIIFVLAFFVVLVTLMVVKSLLCCLCPCCRCGKRRGGEGSASEDSEGHRVNGNAAAATVNNKKSNAKKHK